MEVAIASLVHHRCKMMAWVVIQIMQCGGSTYLEGDLALSRGVVGGAGMWFILFQWCSCRFTQVSASSPILTPFESQCVPLIAPSISDCPPLYPILSQRLSPYPTPSMIPGLTFLPKWPSGQFLQCSVLSSTSCLFLSLLWHIRSYSAPSTTFGHSQILLTSLGVSFRSL